MSAPSFVLTLAATVRRRPVVAAALAVVAVGVTLLFLWSRPLDLAPQVMVCRIDEASLAKHRPWSPAQVAKLVEALGAAGARAVALDLAGIEREAGPTGVEGSWEDEALAAALASFRRGVLAYPAVLTPAADAAVPSSAATRPRVEGEAAGLNLPSAARREAGSEVLREAAWGEGFLAAPSAAAPLVARLGGRLVPSFALAAVAAFENRPIRLTSGGRRLQVGSTSMALDRGGKVKAPAVRLSAGKETISAAEVLAGRGAVVAGRLVWVSFSSREGAENQAAQLAVVSWLMGGAQQARRRLGVGVAAFLGALVAPFTLGLMTLGWGGKKRRLQEEVRRIFAGTLGPEALARWLERPEEVQTAFARRQATVLAAERLGGFMELAEALAPDRLSDALGRSLATLRGRIFEQRGTAEHLDALGLRAVFGAPLPAEDHARRACQAALELRQAVASERGALAAQHELPLARVPLTLEVGLASGALVVGAIPQSAPGGYAALGAPVVTASRLARLCRGYGAAILLSEAVAEAAGDSFLVRELDRVRLRGSGPAWSLFELVSVNPAAPADRQRVVRFQAGLTAYRQREFVKAERLFGSIFEDLGEDGAARVMAERCRRFRAVPPPEGWDGTASIANL